MFSLLFYPNSEIISFKWLEYWIFVIWVKLEILRIFSISLANVLMLFLDIGWVLRISNWHFSRLLFIYSFITIIIIIIIIFFILFIIYFFLRSKRRKLRKLFVSIVSYDTEILVITFLPTPYSVFVFVF